MLSYLQANRISKAAPIEHRHLASSSEVLAALRGFGGGAIGVETHVWPGVRLISLDFSACGQLSVPRTAFYSIVTFSGPPPSIDFDGESHDRTIGTGRVLICGTGQAFDYRWTSAHRASWVCLEPEGVASVAARCGVELHAPMSIGRYVEIADAACDYLISVLEQEARIDSHVAQSIVIESVSNALACRFIGRYSTRRLGPVSPRGALGSRPFEQVCKFIEQNLDARISLGDLAEVAGISRFHFARQFRLRTGESPLGYVLRTRVEHAKVLLRETDARICDIAARLGFSDQSHFTRTFKRMVGVPPSGYAQLYDEAATPESAGFPPDHGATRPVTTRRSQSEQQSAIRLPLSLRC